MNLRKLLQGRGFIQPSPVLYIILFLLTVGSTYLVGLGNGPVGALWYSGGLITILLTHEMGHFLSARKHGIRATYPFFIPFPLPPFGTLGAIIRMEGHIPDRKALFDVGVGGPLAGLAMIVPAVMVGLKLSRVVEITGLEENTITLGDSLLFSLLSRVVHGKLQAGQDILLHPLAFAGWVGLLITSLNLLPVGQLDGGHIGYALFGKRSRIMAVVFYAAFVFIFLFFYVGWILAVILLALVRKHPPTMDDAVPLDGTRKVIGILALVLLVLCFPPVPFDVGEGLVPMILKWLR